MIYDLGKSAGDQIATLLDKTFEVESVTIASDDELRQRTKTDDLVRVIRAGHSR